ncbi:UNVERIFIED_CONTAM: hypothetical protein Slati_1015400 [Sesamum latifolium]|uniref:Uncharacterized protein n=1 Tax=Sesamum latifolium TaxID=2727402 RepID=A0AAW2XRF0_9LAMI
MAKNYDNWERLVRAVLRREGDRELALTHSGDLSSITLSSLSSTSDSSAVDIPMDYSDLTVDHSEWKAMLPPDKQIVVWKSAFLSFFLDPTTGKNCFMLGFLQLLLSKPWATDAHPESRFELVAVPRFIHDTESNYDYSERQDHDHQTWVLSFRQGNDRGDGWMEMKLGDIYIDKGSKGVVEARFLETTGYGMEDLVVEGIEFRPPGFPISSLFVKPTDKAEKRKNRKGKGIFSYFRIPPQY